MKLKKTKRSPLPYVHLHSHEEYSLKDGVGKVEDYINKADSLNLRGFTITNHGSNGQWVRQYYHLKEVNEAREKEGKKPIKNIFGEEVYLMYNRDESFQKMQELNSKLEKGKKKKKDKEDVNAVQIAEMKKELAKSYHLVILAKNQTGFKNLLYLHNEAMMNGYYYHANVDFDLLKKCNEGLVVLSACMGGVIAKPILEGNIKEAERRAKEFKKIFGEDFYIELQLTDFENQKETNIELMRIAEKFDIRTVITNDSHYLEKEDYEAQTVLTLTNSNSTWEDVKNGSKKAWVFESKELWYKTENEIYKEWKDNHSDYLDYSQYKNSILETVKITEKIEDGINFDEKGNHIPLYCNPPEKAESILKSKINAGFKKLGFLGKKKYIDRAKYELEVIKYKNAEHYFLIVQDYVNEIKRKFGEEAVGDGRGSGASSLINNCLGITEIDPLYWNLPFERFLSKGRKDMPDIDVDFLPSVREYLKSYLIKRYGKEYTASISTYGTYQTKAVIDDVLRVYNFPLQTASALKKSLVEDIDDLEDWDEILELNPKLAKFAEENPNIFYVIKRLRGQIRHMSKHAGGVVITRNPIMWDISLNRVGDTLVSSWVEGQTRSELGRIGRVKFDILGLETLEELRYCNDLVEKRTGRRIDWKETNLYDDKKSVKICDSGETRWIFQFQNPGMVGLLKNAKIATMRDWSAISALGRPGAKRSGMADVFCKRSKGKEKYELHELLEQVLGETYGVITYQEHVMLLGVVLADFTMDEADELRKILTKVKKETEHIYGARRDELKAKFIKNGSKKIGKEQVTKIWDLMVEFTRYGFNKAHATCYGRISSKCLYMYAHHQIEFITAVLNSQSKKFKEGEESKLAFYLKEARMLGFDVVFPTVNKSEWQMSISEDGEILYGLSFVKGIGDAPAKAITERKYSKIEDFFNVGWSGKLVGKRVLEPLIKIGYFDELFENRKSLWEAYLEWNEKKTGDFKQFLKRHKDNEDWTVEEKTKMEYQYLGMYVGTHPLEQFENIKEEYDLCSIEEAKDMTQCSVMGMLVSIKPFKCKNGAMMAFMEIESEDNKMSVTCFNKEYEKYKEILKPGSCLAFKIKNNKKGCSVDGYAKGDTIMSLDNLLPKKHKSQKVLKKKKKKLTK